MASQIHLSFIWAAPRWSPWIRNSIPWTRRLWGSRSRCPPTRLRPPGLPSLPHTCLQLEEKHLREHQHCLHTWDEEAKKALRRKLTPEDYLKRFCGCWWLSWVQDFPGPGRWWTLRAGVPCTLLRWRWSTTSGSRRSCIWAWGSRWREPWGCCPSAAWWTCSPATQRADSPLISLVTFRTSRDEFERL